MTDLSNKAMMVILNIRFFNGHKTDKDLSIDIEVDKDAEHGTLSVIKRVIPPQHLFSLRRCRAFTISEHNQMTMPGFHRGERLLTNKMFFRYSTIIGGLSDTFKKLANEFADAYPAILQEAPRRLGKSYKPSDFPPISAIPDMFSIKTRYSPVPNIKDWRNDQVDQETLEKLKKEAEENTIEMFRHAQKDMCDKVEEVLQRLARHIEDFDENPRKKLTIDLFDALKEIGDLIPMMNIADDPAIAKIGEAIKNEIAPIQPERIRQDANLRNKIKNLSIKLMKEMP